MIGAARDYIHQLIASAAGDRARDFADAAQVTRDADRRVLYEQLAIRAQRHAAWLYAFARGEVNDDSLSGVA